MLDTVYHSNLNPRLIRFYLNILPAYVTGPTVPTVKIPASLVNIVDKLRSCHYFNPHKIPLTRKANGKATKTDRIISANIVSINFIVFPFC